MPANSDPNNTSNQNSNQQPQAPTAPANTFQISSSDAPPLPADVQPINDADTPRPGKAMDEPIPAPQVNALPEANMPPPSITPTADPMSSTPSTAAPVLEGSGTTTVASSGSRGFPKKLLFIIGGLLIILVVVFLVIRFVLPLFSNQNTGDGNNTPINQTEIVWWGLWEDQQIVAPVINEYQQNNPGIKITYVPQSKENYRERLTSAIARGEGPDIFRFHNTWVPMFIEELATVPNDVMSQQEFSQTFYPVMTRDLLTPNGLVGIPLEVDGLSLFVNDEIFRTFAKTPPTTWVEFEELAAEMTVRDTNRRITQAGAAIGNTENVDHWPELLGLIMLQNGVNLNNVESLQSEQAAQALQFYTDFVSESQVWDDTLPSSTIAFSSGQVAMMFAPSWRIFEIGAQNPNLEYRVMPVPQIPREDTSIPDITYASYWAEGVAENSDKQDEAWAFLDYLASKETMQSFYESASQVRTFGEPYSRLDMRDMLLNVPKIGAFVQLAPTAQSWYLAARTWDGETGINSRINSYFEDAVNGMVGQRSGNAESLMQAVAAGVQEVFVQYGLAAPAPVTSEE